MLISIQPEHDSVITNRVKDLVRKMTLQEKIGQMTQVEKNSIIPEEVNKYFIGSVLSGGGGYPTPNTPSKWLEMVNSYQDAALHTRMAIPMLYGVDAVHGHNNVHGAVIFPHNIGLGATHNEALISQIAKATAEEMVATGIFWNFAPTIAIPQDVRWGRTYEGYSENTELVTRLGKAYLQGLQGDKLSSQYSVLASPKHYVGDGGTAWGTSIFLNYKLDQGITQLDERALRSNHLPPYISAIHNGAMSIMASLSSWNGQKIAANRYLLTDVLKKELGFSGFVVSDWQAIDQVSEDYYQSVVLAINAGIDLCMVPYNYKKFISTLSQAIEKGDISLRRINDAVSRILTVKYMLDLFDHPYRQDNLLSLIGSEAHRMLARQAVRESLVLLKNDQHTLPLSKSTRSILVAGKGADNLGIQCGGWTVEWGGIDGNLIPGTTIVQGIREKVSINTKISFSPTGKFADDADLGRLKSPAEVGIVVVGELPYAEGMGDREDLHLSQEDISLIEQMRARCQRLVTILISGRPMIITELLPSTDSFVCAWLPGQEGGGIADVLFGEADFKGMLPYTWPRSMDQIPLDHLFQPPGEQKPLFPFGYGLHTN